MDFGQDLEPEELTKHYDQYYGIDFETEEEEDEELHLLMDDNHIPAGAKLY